MEEGKPQSFQILLQKLRDGYPIIVETGSFSRTLLYEDGDYFEQTPSGKKRISLGEAQSYIRLMIARWRRERRERRKEEMTQ